MATPAEERAERDGLPVVALPTFDLVHTASGHPMIVTTLDGREVLLRLMTPDEAMEAQRAAVATLPEDCRPPLMSRERAADLVRPIG